MALSSFGEWVRTCLLRPRFSAGSWDEVRMQAAGQGKVFAVISQGTWPGWVKAGRSSARVSGARCS